MGGGLGRIGPIVESQGTLVVDLSSGQNKNLLWRGTAADTLSDSPAKNTKKIEESGGEDVQKLSAQKEVSDRISTLER
jgi:hypothetical protein